MIGYIDIEEQVDADFNRARLRVLLRRAGALLRGVASTRLPTFEEARKARGAYNKVRLGRRVVPVEKIVGSVGRSTDFDATFLPARASVRTKWERIDRAFHLGEELPPVVLHKLGDAYFVEDGNHRVSVARYQGVQWIDAEVTELHVRLPVAFQPTGTEPGYGQTNVYSSHSRQRGRRHAMSTRL